MQAVARERCPDADPNRLPLVPRQVTNRDGLKPLSPGTLARKMRVWVSALSELSGPDGEPFDRATVFPLRVSPLLRPAAGGRGRQRSEERRVGKECRSRWSP